MKIRFISQGARPPAVEAPARRAALAALRHEGVRAKQDLNVIWAARERVRELNRRFRGKNRFTDVIAFRYDDAENFHALPRRGRGAAPFGDLYIAVGQARLNAKRFGVPFKEELVRLVTHGTLHLLGYT